MHINLFIKLPQSITRKNYKINFAFNDVFFVEKMYNILFKKNTLFYLWLVRMALLEGGDLMTFFKHA